MKVLVADDELTNRRLLEVSLPQWGHEVVMACDGAEAWQILQQEDAPQLVLLDWMMPEMDGIEVCRKLRERPASKLTYVILITARTDKDDVVAGLEAGADDYVTKPIDRKELRARVQVGVRMLEMQAHLAEQARELEAERQRARQRETMTLERERADAAVSVTSDGIVFLDGEYRVTSANRAGCRLLNIPLDNPHGLAMEGFIQPFTLSIPLEEVLQSKDRVTSLEISRMNTEPPLILDGRLARVFDREGRLDGSVLTVRDVTEERRAQSTRAEFFVMVSHKLRTPMVIIQGYLDFITQLPPEAMVDMLPEVLETSRSEMRRLSDAVEKLLEFKTISQQELEAESRPTAVKPVIGQAIQEVSRRYSFRFIESHVEVAPGASTVSASPGHLQVLLDKLLDNAVKFCPREPVEIEVEVQKAEGGMLRFSVTDNGTGIPHEYLDRILEGFVQVEDFCTGNVPGLGVGLLLAKQVAAAYGGSISIHSTLGEGTTVSFTLPVEG